MRRVILRYHNASRSFAAVTATVMITLTAATAALAAPSGATAPPQGAARAGGTWGAAQEIAAGLNAGGAAAVTSVSCASKGNCAIGGYFTDSSGNRQAFLAGEVKGTWGAAQEIAADLNAGGGGNSDLTAGEGAAVTSVSCASKGNCAAGGYFTDSSGNRQAFLAGEVKGTWGAAQEIAADLNTGGFARVNSVSCASKNNCAAGGSYVGSGQSLPFVAGEVDGTWGAAQEVPGTADVNAGGVAQVSSVSCGSAGDCAAGGLYLNSSFHEQAFVATEVNGTWGAAQQVPGTAQFASLNSVSCPSAGACGGGGSSSFQAFVTGEANGTWGAAQQVPGTADLNAGRYAMLLSVSCASAGNCSAGGSYSDSSSHEQAFVATEVNGTWGAAQEIAADLNAGGVAQVSSVSCGSPGNCGAGGSYIDSSGNVQAFVVNQA